MGKEVAKITALVGFLFFQFSYFSNFDMQTDVFPG